MPVFKVGFKWKDERKIRWEKSKTTGRLKRIEAKTKDEAKKRLVEQYNFPREMIRLKKTRREK